jgi:hypothetical protein
MVRDGWGFIVIGVALGTPDADEPTGRRAQMGPGTPCTTPAIRPGGRFEVRIIPKRAGTFTYHTHFDEQRQTYGGLVAKDGWSLAGALASVRRSGQRVATGETADFEYTPDRPGDFRFEAFQIDPARGVMTIAAAVRSRVVAAPR